jgi:List-Bact-rpt repeat protein/VPS62-like protein/thrombospondin type 3 repeat protein/WD40 repeat protein
MLKHFLGKGVSCYKLFNRELFVLLLFLISFNQITWAEELSDADALALAQDFMPVLWLSSGEVDLKSSTPWTDYIPIDVQNISTNHGGISEIYRADNDTTAPLDIVTLNALGLSIYFDENNYINIPKDHYTEPSIQRDPTVYYRVFYNPDQRYAYAIQYWFFYYNNDWQLNGGINILTDHQGDWETVTVFLEDGGQLSEVTPKEVVFSTHYEANRFKWSDVEKFSGSNRFNLYVSNGGHGSYAHSGITNYGKYCPVCVDAAKDRHLGDEEQIVSYNLVDLKILEGSTSWLEFEGAFGEVIDHVTYTEKGPPSPLYRTDVPTSDDYGNATNPPLDPNNSCFERYNTNIYGSYSLIDLELFGPWRWAYGYPYPNDVDDCLPVPFFTPITNIPNDTVISTFDVNFSWSIQSDGAEESFQIFVQDSSGESHRKWFNRLDVCNAPEYTSCTTSWEPIPSFANGSASWKVKGAHRYGNGPWSSTKQFTYSPAGLSYALNITKSGSSSGLVISSPTGISCGLQCQQTFSDGTPVTLMTQWDPTTTSFDGWGGDCTSFGTGSCTLTMDTTKNVSAIFSAISPPISHTLTVNKNGEGSVISNPSGISCGSNCSDSYVEGTEVTLTANWNENFHYFNGWSGDCSSSGDNSQCTVLMSEAKNVTADFNQLEQITTRISIAYDGSEANGGSGSSMLGSSISASGRYIVFESSSDNLVSGDLNNTSDIFLRDTLEDSILRVSVDSNGIEGNSLSTNPHISANGRYITFTSHANNLVPDDNNNTSDIFIHDRIIGSTIRASLSSVGLEGNGSSQNSSISGDGRFVAFESRANNLVSVDVNNPSYLNIYLRDTLLGITSIIGVASDGTLPGIFDFSKNPEISNDGRYIAFESDAILVGNDTNSRNDIFVHDQLSGDTERVSIATDGSEGDHFFISNPTISADGRFVAFQSDAENLILNDTNNSEDIFVRDRLLNETTRVSISSEGGQADNYSEYPAISADGRFISFTSAATNLVLDDTNPFEDIFVHDRGNNTTRMISVTSNGTKGNNFFLGVSSISADGRYITFPSDADNLVLNDENNTTDSFLVEQLLVTPKNMLLVNPSIGGSVTDINSDIDCGNDCVEFYQNVSQVTLTAEPNTGETFEGWTGACTGTELQCTVLIDETTIVTANFTQTIGSILGSDNFNNAGILSGSTISITDTNTGATKESGEPSHASNSGGASVWWQWTAPSVGDVTIDTIGSNFDTTLGVYTGSQVDVLTTIASNDDFSGFQSGVNFTAVAGTTYFIAVDGYSGVTGNIQLNLEFVPPPSSASLGEALDNTQLTWTTSGDAFWSSQTTESYFGGSAVESGQVSFGQSSLLETTITESGTLTFYYKQYGAVSWEQVTIEVTSGTHTLTWQFIDNYDPNTFTGTQELHILIDGVSQYGILGSFEKVWIDKVEFVPGEIVNNDLDNDGMPNDYEDSYSFLDPNDPSDANLDFDNDGRINIAEYFYGTDPSVFDPPHICMGIYKGIGTYSTSPANQEDALFSLAVDQFGAYLLFGYDEVYSDGFKKFGSNQITVDGVFNEPDVDGLGTSVIGTCNELNFSGSFSNDAAGNGTFTSSKLTTTGQFDAVDGWYTGTVAGDTEGTVDGFLSAEDSLFFYIEGTNSLFGNIEDGGWLTVQSNGSFTGTTINGVDFTGTVDTLTGTISGTYQNTSVSQSGTFTTALAFSIPNIVTPTLDADSDGLLDVNDNCPTVANADQTNTDGDSEGDACDSDDDNDGLSDTIEASLGTNPLLADTDSDGVDDNVDAFPLDISETTDTDGDGIGDNTDTALTVLDGDVDFLITAINAANDEETNLGLDIIELAESGSYQLNSTVDTTDGNTGLPAITSEIIIKGNGATISGSTDNLICDGGIDEDEFRIFLVNTASGKLTLNNTTVSGGCTFGSDGGGITVIDGSLNLNNSAVLDTNNQPNGGVYSNGGTVTISR